jgi:hypothetical protein
MRKRELNSDVAREIFRYIPETGNLFWMPRDSNWFASIRAEKAFSKNFEGREALASPTAKGYKAGALWGKSYLAHRVIWLLMTGSWPEGDIDHINGIRSDNRWSNLRAVSRTENMRNKRKNKNNKSGHVGVHWHARDGRWVAKIGHEGRDRWLGQFGSLDDAVAARKAAERECGYHKNHGRM